MAFPSARLFQLSWHDRSHAPTAIWIYILHTKSRKCTCDPLCKNVRKPFISRSNRSSYPLKKVSIRSNGSSYPCKKLASVWTARAIRLKNSIHTNGSSYPFQKISIHSNGSSYQFKKISIHSKNLASVRTAQAICSKKFVSHSNSLSYPFKSAIRMARAIRPKKIVGLWNSSSCPVQKILF